MSRALKIGTVAITIVLFAGLLVPLIWWRSLRRGVVLNSPDHRFSVHLVGRFSRPIFPLTHSVYASVYDASEKVTHERLVHSGDYMDPWFDLWYPQRLWVDDRILRLTRPNDKALTDFDRITVRNLSSQRIGFLQVNCRDMYLFLDIADGEVKHITAPMQANYTDYSWIAVEGQFSNKNDIKYAAKNFSIGNGSKHYSIDIKDQSVELTLDAD